MTPWIWIPLDNKMNSRNIFQLLPYSAVWTFQDFSVTHILREINCHFEAQKIAIFINSLALNFEYLAVFDIFKC